MTPALQAVVDEMRVIACGWSNGAHRETLLEWATRIERSGGVGASPRIDLRTVNVDMVANALAANMAFTLWENREESSRDYWRKHARAAIEAMSDAAPTQSAQPAQGPTFSLEAPTGQPVHVWTDADREGVRSAMQVIVDREQAQPQGEVVAWLKRNNNGDLISITSEGLQNEPEWIQEIWREAMPLYTRPQVAQGGPITPALQAVVAKAEAAFLRAYVAAGGEARWLHDLPLTAGIQAAIESTRIERSGGVVVDEAMMRVLTAAPSPTKETK